MRLQIINSIKNIIFDENINYLKIEGQNNFEIFEEHAPLIASLGNISTLQYKRQSTNDSETLQIKNGFLEIQKKNKMTTIKIIEDF